MVDLLKMLIIFPTNSYSLLGAYKVRDGKNDECTDYEVKMLIINFLIGTAKSSFFNETDWNVFYSEIIFSIEPF